MTALPYLIGVDPGETTGIAVCIYGSTPHGFIQCSANMALPVIRGLTMYAAPVLCMERFVIGHRATRSIRADAGHLTRELITDIKTEFAELRIIERNAGEVKPWGTDARLKAAGLWTPMRHARDAARHALFAACHDFRMPDPLSVKR